MLRPNSFRPESIRKISKEYPATEKFHKWFNKPEIKKLTCDYLSLPKGNLNLWQNHHINQIKHLTLYILQYNYYLAKYVEQCPQLFDSITLREQKLCPKEHWTREETFMQFFEYVFRFSIGRIKLNGEVMNYSKINEDLTGFDETLPQHYGVPTACLDGTKNPYVDLFFAIQNIPTHVSQISIIAYKEFQATSKTPFVIKHPNSQCINPRVINQDGIFICMKYACHYYFDNGSWPCMENFVTKGKNNYEIIKYIINTREVEYLREILLKQGITKEFLFPKEDLICELAT